MGFSSVNGVDAVLDTPPSLTAPPLSLIDLAKTLIDDEGEVADIREATERLQSLQAQQAEIARRMADAAQEDVVAAQRALEDNRTKQEQLDAYLTDMVKRRAAVERWEHGFQYLPELGVGATELFVPDTATPNPANADPTGSANALKGTGNNQTPFAWYDPFEAIARDERSTFGYPYTGFDERAGRAGRGGKAHEAWQCEQEFWAGIKIPTNFHLTASPASATSSPHRTIDAWTDPDPVPGTALGDILGIAASLAALDQAIAEADAGTGMIHATPYMVQRWMQVYPFIRDSVGRVYTVNMNLIVPGYGYPGTGPDVASRTVNDGVLNSTTTVTSATAAFTFRDIGASISDDDGEIPAGAYIVSVTNATTVIISKAATASEGSATLTIGGVARRRGGDRYQWAYATEYVFKCRGDVQTYPEGFEQMSPQMNVDNNVPVRSERPWALITNRLLRAAVLVDSSTI